MDFVREVDIMYLTAVVDNIENTENWKKLSPKFKIYQTIIGNEADVFLLCQDFLGNRLSDAINAIKEFVSALF